VVTKSLVRSLLCRLVVAHDSASQVVVGTKDQSFVSVDAEAPISSSKYSHLSAFALLDDRTQVRNLFAWSAMLTRFNPVTSLSSFGIGPAINIHPFSGKLLSPSNTNLVAQHRLHQKPSTKNALKTILRATHRLGRTCMSSQPAPNVTTTTQTRVSHGTRLHSSI
jgi:hypothetical protein